jgi:hypothetical protein
MNFQGENIKMKNIEAILSILILSFALWIFDNSARTPENNGISSSIVSSINRIDAIPCSKFPIYLIEKSLITTNHNFKLLHFNKDPNLEDRRVEIRISVLQIIQQNLDKSPPFTLQYHLFPIEKDELPILS